MNFYIKICNRKYFKFLTASLFRHYHYLNFIYVYSTFLNGMSLWDVGDYVASQISLSLLSVKFPVYLKKIVLYSPMPFTRFWIRNVFANSNFFQIFQWLQPASREPSIHYYFTHNYGGEIMDLCLSMVDLDRSLY